MSGIPVSLQNISKKFSMEIEAVSKINLNIPAGQFISIVGPSGCGKSTLLRLIAGLETPSEGEVTVEKNEIAYVFQDAHLLPWRKVLSNVVLPLELEGFPEEARLRVAKDALKKVHLEDFESAYPSQLSGGMKMRASIARALSTHPKLLLLDEPFGALDEITRQSLENNLRELWMEQKMTVIFVTHSISEACFLSDRCVVLSKRPGKICLDIPLPFPEKRETSLRLSTSFNEITQKVYESLSKGMVG